MGIPVTTKLLAVSVFGESPESEQFRQDVSAGKASMVTKTVATSNGLILHADNPLFHASLSRDDQLGGEYLSVALTVRRPKQAAPGEMADMRRNGNIGRMMAVLAFGPPEGRTCLQSNVPVAATKLQCDHLLEQAVLSGLCCPSIPPSDYLACIACRMSPTTRWSSLHMAGSPAQRTATSPHSYRPARAMRRRSMCGGFVGQT